VTLYCVIQTGVYRHAIVGVYSSELDACARAVKCAREERDKYHSWEVATVEIDTDIDDVTTVREYEWESKPWHKRYDARLGVRGNDRSWRLLPESEES